MGCAVYSIVLSNCLLCVATLCFVFIFGSSPRNFPSRVQLHLVVTEGGSNLLRRRRKGTKDSNQPEASYALCPQKIYFPFKEADNGLLYFPILPSPEHTFCDTSGKFRLRSRQGNYYYTVFVDSKTGEKLLFPHRKKKHFPLVFLQFVARIGMYPKKLFSDKAGEIESSTFGKLILVRGVESITVPKGEHYSNPHAEKAIQDLDKMLKAILLDSGIPHDCWDIVVQHCALINSMTSPSLLDPSKTIFEVVNGVIPDLDALPLVGCLAVRLEEKSFRVDQKLDAMNQPGVFVGFANLQNTYGSVILTDTAG